MNNRQNGRRRGRGGQQVRGGQPNNQDRGNRIDNRARGNAAQLLEKYKSLARDAQMQGDRVNTEYYLQFADHYFRVLSESRARFEEQRPQRREDYRGDEMGNEGEGDEGEGQRGYENRGVGAESNWDGEDDRPPAPQQPRQQRERERPMAREDGAYAAPRENRRPDEAEQDGNRSDGNRNEGNRNERAPRQPRVAQGEANGNNGGNGNGNYRAAEASEPSERIEVDRLPAGFGAPVEGVEGAPVRRRAPRRPRETPAVEA